jgi:glutamate synthase domain-containing protein 1
VPTNDSALGKVAKSTEPHMEQVFVGTADGSAELSPEDFKRKASNPVTNPVSNFNMIK